VVAGAAAAAADVVAAAVGVGRGEERELTEHLASRFKVCCQKVAGSHVEGVYVFLVRLPPARWNNATS